MKSNRQKIRNHLIRTGISIFLLLITYLGYRIALSDPTGFSSWYLSFSSSVGKVISAITSIFPFSLAEILIYILVAGVPITLIIALIFAIFKKKSIHPFLLWLTSCILTASIIITVFMTSWGYSYTAPSLSSRLGYDEPDTSTQALYELTLYLADHLEEESQQITRNEDQTADFGTFDDQAELVSQAAEKFFDSSDVFDGSSVKVKPVLASEALNYTGITGIYICVTGESNVNTTSPDCILPYVMAHETSHRAAIAPEDEANFLAYLICISSDSAEVRYSGYYQTFIYCANALQKLDEDLSSDAYTHLDENVYADLRYHSKWCHQYDGEVKTQSENMNDNYLKTLNQSSGINSYSEVVDLLLSWYQQTDHD